MNGKKEKEREGGWFHGWMDGWMDDGWLIGGWMDGWG
jgi:hypothetical protein